MQTQGTAIEPITITIGNAKPIRVQPIELSYITGVRDIIVCELIMMARRNGCGKLESFREISAKTDIPFGTIRSIWERANTL